MASSSRAHGSTRCPPCPLPAAHPVGARGAQPVRRGRADRPLARASARTRRQYGATFRAFGDWLAGELCRPPLVGDVDADVIAAYGRHLAACGGRGGGSAAPVTVRVYLLLRREVTGADTERDSRVATSRSRLTDGSGDPYQGGRAFRGFAPNTSGRSEKLRNPAGWAPRSLSVPPAAASWCVGGRGAHVAAGPTASHCEWSRSPALLVSRQLH